MDLDLAIRSRRAVRDFKDTPVARPFLTRLIDAAVQAPSAMNEQPWAFTVVQDRGILTRVSTRAKAYALRDPSLDLPRSLRDLLGRPDFDLFHHAPALIVISSESRSRWAVENCALAAQNLMLCACAEGLGSCWIGLAQP